MLSKNRTDGSLKNEEEEGAKTPPVASPKKGQVSSPPSGRLPDLQTFALRSGRGSVNTSRFFNLIPPSKSRPSAPVPYKDNRCPGSKPISIFTGTWNTEYQEFPMDKMLSANPASRQSNCGQALNLKSKTSSCCESVGWNKRLTMNPKVLTMDKSFHRATTSRNVHELRSLAAKLSTREQHSPLAKHCEADDGCLKCDSLFGETLPDDELSEAEFDTELLTHVPAYHGVTKCGFPLPDRDPFDDWIEPGHDVYVISLQESISDSIVKAIEEYLNRMGSGAYVPIKYDDVQLSGLGDGAYLSPKSTVVACWVSESALHPSGPVKPVTSKSVSLSMLNGSKGAVCVVLCVYGQYICFLGCHMPATGPEARLKAREFIARKISEAYSGYPDIGWLDVFHHIVWMGDFNFRVADVSAPDFVRLLEREDGIAVAFKHDELQNDKWSEDLATEEFEELPITFMPSYKMKDGRGPVNRQKPNWTADVYATMFKVRWYKGGRVKERVPSWTDRILKRSMAELYYCCTFTSGSYKAAEASSNNILLGSDHTPISCSMNVYALADGLIMPTILMRANEERVEKITRNTFRSHLKAKRLAATSQSPQSPTRLSILSRRSKSPTPDKLPRSREKRSHTLSPSPSGGPSTSRAAASRRPTVGWRRKSACADDGLVLTSGIVLSPGDVDPSSNDKDGNGDPLTSLPSAVHGAGHYGLDAADWLSSDVT